MGQGLKQRVLGAVLLIGLLVLLAPALFQGGKDHPLVKGNLPPAKPSPEIPAFINVLETPPEPVDVVEKATRPEEDERGQSGIDAQGHLKAWSLQLASFSDESNAGKLVTTLRDKGHAAYIRKVQQNKARWLYRVYVGPEVRTRELVELKGRLQKELGLSGIVVRYHP
ncbi:SPOR domain-containing protein [Endozoicomonas sp. Mp262]|uniref:SPOR domain-containing protein n=1 Tax=Endozoicomonas sp. Mp262 TaxID=2919499 RepID=UPI0021DA64F6